MKDLTLSVAAVVAIALVMGLAFHGVYPLVDVGANLAALFVFVAVVLKLVLGWLWALLHKPRPAAGGEVAK